MTENEINEKLTHLLADRATQGLNFEETSELEALEGNPEFEDWSMELAAAAAHLSVIETKDEILPLNLQTKILASSDKYFAENFSEKSDNVVSIGTKPKLSLVVNNEKSEPPKDEFSDSKAARVVEFPARKLRGVSGFGKAMQWSGWAVAAAACIVLAFVLWRDPIKPKDVAISPTPIPTPRIFTPAEQREQLLTAADVLKIDYPKSAQGVTGDVVWSNSQQKGYVHLKGIPKNDAAKETYQLWIADANQDKPIDAGIFDVTAEDGEIIIPLNAKLKVVKPQLFAVTKEKPGGVVVSKLNKLIVAAKV